MNKVKHNKPVFILADAQGYINTFTVNPMALLIAWTYEVNRGRKVSTYKQTGKNNPAPCQVEDIFNEISAEDQLDMLARITPFNNTVN